MNRFSFAALGTIVLGLTLAASTSPVPPGSTPALAMAVAHAATPLTPVTIDAQNRLVNDFCAGCHDDELKKGGLSFENFDAARSVERAEVTERMIRKLRAGMMPPPGAKRPDAPTLTAFVTSLETPLDEAAAIHPNPGRRTFQRLNRAEYARSIH